MRPIATFSIVAHDPLRDEWGVAVQSKFLAVASVVSWARAGAGAIATQARANLNYGPQGLDILEDGISAKQTIKKLTSEDDGRDYRQVGIVDQQGKAFAYTGSACKAWAGHLIGEAYACQGNILFPGTIEAMAEQFEQVRVGEGELADWLVAALKAGQAAGGDSRGRQSAGVLVVRKAGGYGGNNDRYIDLRVDDDPEPIKKLQLLLDKHHLYYGETNPGDLIPLSEIAAEIQGILQAAGHANIPTTGAFDEQTREALKLLVGIENLEERWNGKDERIDKVVFMFLQGKYK
ncbi:MAG: DUF1028 domain-containing protein [Anaerolineales bacterium]|nr:DUF1028 domain-containing protein [Chloroflexota bacterium]MBL6980094.1 DUF1028 domain-containing protein [Anaerolineales bacterium]